jgi:hypothetical protein
MPKCRGQREDRKSVGREIVGQRRILIHELLHTRELPRRRGFIELQRNSPSEHQIPDLFSAGIHGH